MGRYKLVRIEGKSMIPRLHDGEFCIIDSSKKTIKSIGLGDIIVFRLYKEQLEQSNRPVECKLAIKRVADIKFACGKTYFRVLGDNRKCSFDSRMYGYIQQKQIIGVLVKNTHEESKVAATMQLFDFMMDRWQ